MNTPQVIFDHSVIDFDAPGKRHYQVAFHLDGGWGYSLVPLTVINGAEPAAPGVAAFGGTHGNEWEGQVAIRRLCADLDPSEMSGRLILMPQLSESACAANTRFSPLDGVNMNRAFPGDARGTISLRIAHFVTTRVFPFVGVVLDIHSGGNEGVFPVPTTSYHPIADPAQREEIARVAELFDPAIILIYSEQMASGLLTDEAESAGKIAVGGEFGGGGSVSRKGMRHVYEGIRNVLRHYGMLPGLPVKIDPGMSKRVDASRLSDYIPAPRNGIWEPLAELGGDLAEGELIGRLHDFQDHTAAPLEIRAHRAGVLAMLYQSAVCERGRTMYVIGTEVRS